MTTRYNIRNMICSRCIKAVEQIFIDLGATPIQIELGFAEVEHPPFFNSEDLRIKLESEGFKLLQRNEEILVEQIKLLVVKLARNDFDTGKVNVSTHIAQGIGKSYSYLSKLFSQETGLTIEQFVIRHRIERVKELLSEGELSLGQIASKLRYSSIQHLSRQFKSITGKSAREYKAKPFGRIPLDKLDEDS